MMCAPSKDSNHPEHSRSLIRIFTLRILDSQVSFMRSSLDARVRGYVFLRYGSNNIHDV